MSSLEDIYRNIRLSLPSIKIEWISPESFKFNYNDSEFIFDNQNHDVSKLGIENKIINRPSKKLTGRISRFMDLHLTRYPYRSNNKSSPQPEYLTKRIDFKKDVYLPGFSSNPVTVYGVKNFNNIKIYFPNRCSYTTINDEFDNAILIKSDAWEKFKTECDFPDYYRLQGNVYEPLEISESYLNSKWMLQEFENNNIYSSYFKFHKPNEFISLNNRRLKILENIVSYSLESMDKLSRECSNIPFKYNIILKEIGFELQGRSCVCKIDKWNKFKEFMKTDSKIEEKTTNHSGCYLLQLNCDKGSNKYKIGKSFNLLTRLKSTEYRNAFIKSCCYVSDINNCEKELISRFNSKFININDSEEGGFGNEIFEGNIKEMMNEFWDVCKKY